MVSFLQLQPLVPVHQFDKLPSYYIFAGFIFVPLTQPYLHEYGEDWYNASPRKLCEKALRELPNKAGEQLVILSQVFLLFLDPIYCNSLMQSCKLLIKHTLFFSVYVWCLSHFLLITDQINFYFFKMGVSFIQCVLYSFQVLMDDVNTGYERLAELQVTCCSHTCTHISFSYMCVYLFDDTIFSVKNTKSSFFHL